MPQLTFGSLLQNQHMMRVLSILLCVLWSSTLTAQNAGQKFTISGVVKSKQKGETLIGATIRIGNTATASNEYGFFSVTLPGGSYTLLVTAVGLQPYTQEINLDKDQRIDISLDDEIKSLENVVVTSQAKGRSISSPQMGVERISTKDIKNLPVLLGERDILKTIQLLPSGSRLFV